MEDKILRITYNFFLGLIIALFVGMGISTFYPSPEAPEYSPVSSYGPEKPDEKELAYQREYENKYQSYSDKLEVYHRNVSIITLVASVLLLGASLLLEKKSNVISNGILLGGLFTLIYSTGRGIASGNSQYTFIAVSVALAIVLFLGYRRFANRKTSRDN